MAGPGSLPVRKRGGQRRHKVTLQSASTTVDSMGGQPEGQFSAFGTDWAAIDEIPFIVNGSEHGMLYKVTIKYRADIRTEFETSNKRVRIVGPETTYALLEIENPEGRNIELILHCAPV